MGQEGRRGRLPHSPRSSRGGSLAGRSACPRLSRSASQVEQYPSLRNKGVHACCRWALMQCLACLLMMWTGAYMPVNDVDWGLYAC
jgi:hypothetical protein